MFDVHPAIHSIRRAPARIVQSLPSRSGKGGTVRTHRTIAIAVSPKLVIADELSLGLAPLVTESVFEGLEAARQSGITIVLTEQFVHRALAMADGCVILTRGHVGWAGEACDAGQEVIDRYLGEAETPTPAGITNGLQ